MSVNSEHIIKSQQYNILLQDENEATDFQTKVSRLQEKSVNQLLDKILTKYSQDGSIYQFDQIEIDLGAINKNNFEQELLFRLEEELTAFFEYNVFSDGTLKKGRKIIVNDKHIEQLEHFLLRGYFPWNASSGKPSKILKKLLTEKKTDLIELLTIHGKKEQVRKRIIEQFDDEILENIVVAVADTESTYMIKYRKNILQYQHKQISDHTRFGNFRNVVWDIILSYLFYEKRSYYNRKSFLSYIIRKMAEKYGFSYSELLNALIKGIDYENTEISGNQEFKKIVAELYHTEQLSSDFGRSETPNFNLHKPQGLETLLDYYFENGSVPIIPELKSIHAFDQLLFRYITDYKSRAKEYFDNKLMSDSQNIVLLLSFKTKILHKIARFSSIPEIVQCLEFVNRFLKIKSSFLSNYQGVVKGISENDGVIIFRSYAAAYKKDKQLIPIIINEIISTLNVGKKEILHFLDDICSEFSLGEQSQIKAYLKFVNDKKNENLLTIGKNEYIERLEKFLLDYKYELINNSAHKLQLLHDQILCIANEQKKDRIVIVSELIQFVNSWPLNEELLTVIKKIREEILIAETKIFATDTQETEGNISIQDFNELLEKIRIHSEIITDYEKLGQYLKQVLTEFAYKNKLSFYVLSGQLKEIFRSKGVQQKIIAILDELVYADKQTVDQKKTIHYLVDTIEYYGSYGKMPWWFKELSEADLAEYISLLWEKSPDKYIAIIKNKPFANKLVFLIDPGMYPEIIKKLDEISGVFIFKYYQLVEQFCFEQILPLSYLTQEGIRKFQNNLIVQLIQKPTTINVAFILNDLIRNINIDQKKVSRFLYEYVKKSKIKLDYINDTKFWFEEKYGCITDFPAEDMQNKYLNWLVHGKNIKSDLMNQESLFSEMIRMQEANPGLIRKCMLNTEARKRMLTHFNETQLASFISVKKGTAQIRQFEGIKNILNHLKKHMTTTRYKDIQHHFYDTVLLRLGIETRTPTQKDWIWMLYKAMNKILGINEIVEISGKLAQDFSEISHNSEKQVIKEMQAFSKTETLETQKTIEPELNKREKDIPSEDELLGEIIYTENAGLVILAPFLSTLFERLELMEASRFKDREASNRAVHILQYAATGKTESEENEMILNKILVGLDVDAPIIKDIQLSEKEKDTVMKLLEEIIRQWTILKNTSVEGLQESFLKRKGRLTIEEEKYILQVEKQSYDMLLDQIPWSFSKIKLSWMKKILLVEWRQ